MKEITAIEEQIKAPNRVSVYINQVFAFGVTKKQAEYYGICVGRKLSEEEYQLLLENLQMSKARQKAFDYLSRSNKTIQEMRKKLIELEYEEEIVEKVIEFLVQYNYLNDKEFAKQFTRYSRQYKHKSKKQIQYELYQKGISSNLIEEAFEELQEEEIEEGMGVEKENILYYLKKYRYSREMEYHDKNKIIMRIIRRGYSYDQVKSVLENLE